MRKKINLNANKNSKASFCRYCGEITKQIYRPFCSRRCSQLDLGRWLNEDYIIPVVEYDYVNDKKIDGSD